MVKNNTSKKIKPKITVIQDDITKLTVDVIVNAANKTLLGGGGIDGAIHYAAGPMLLEECKMLGGCKTGDVKVTKAYKLQAKHVIHTVGPIYERENGREHELLSLCYINSMNLANQLCSKTIAFPCISTGAFRFPRDVATKIAIETIQKYLLENETKIEEIIFVTFNELDYKLYNQKINTNSIDISKF